MSGIFDAVANLVVWLIQSIVGFIAWVISSVVSLLVWLIREGFELLKAVVGFYVKFGTQSPGAAALTIFFFGFLYFTWWGVLSRLGREPKVWWEFPGYVLTLAFPLVSAILGLILN